MTDVDKGKNKSIQFVEDKSLVGPTDSIPGAVTALQVSLLN